MNVKYVVAIIAVIVVIIAFTSSTFFLPSEKSKKVVKILCAGSLMIPLKEAEERFEQQHPNVDVEIEGHGSIQVIRHITEIHEEADVLMVADCSLIPDMMYTVKIPGTNESYANWYIKFARNDVVLAYNQEKSKYADEINSTNWYSVLERADVTIGFSNPVLDACGYRALIVCQLAELYYNDSTLFENLITQNFHPKISATKTDDLYIVLIPEVLEPKSEKIILRGGSVQLLALLESGGLDYAFQYRSVALQHGLKFLELPSEINLGSAEYESFYKKVKVRFMLQRFASVGTERTGEPIVYGITIPENAPHKKLAVEFLKFILGSDGQGIFSYLHQPIISPAVTDNLDMIPNTLKTLVKGED